MAKKIKPANKETKRQKKDKSRKKDTHKEDPSINKYAKESGESKHNDIDEDNES